MPSRRRFTASCAGLLLAAALATAAAADDGPLRRVLLISVDTLAADHVGCYGHDEPTTATLDSLAAHGVRFAHCLVPQVWTLSSHMSMFTSLAPGVHRVGMDRPLADGVPTVATRLATAGFTACGTFTANYWLDARFGFARGFTAYAGVSLGQPAGARLVDQLRAHTDPDGAWFGFVHYMDPHSLPTTRPFPYQPLDPGWWRYEPGRTTPTGRHVKSLPPDDPFHGRVEQWDLAKYDVAFLRGSYDDSIRYWDGVRLPRLLRRLRAEGLLHDMLLIVTADHGEEFGQHGRFLHQSPHREVRKVPLVMVWPGRLPAGVVVTERVSVMDIAPTILDLADLDPLPRTDGVSLRPLLEDPDASLPRRDFFVDGHHRGYRREPSALVTHLDGRWWMLEARQELRGGEDSFRPARVTHVEALYDLDRDPLETRDLSAERPDLVDRLRMRLADRLAQEAAAARRLRDDHDDTGDVGLTEHEKRRLKSLGY